MNWIKQNTFTFGLVVTTLVGALLLWVLGSAAAGRYDAAKEEYDSAFSEVSQFEKLDPYPSAEHLASKKLAVEEYSEEAAELQMRFDAYRPESLEKITVQAFADAVKVANEETRAAFGKDIEIPEAYHCGFEAYRTAMPPGNATGILNYQLGATKQLMLNLAEAGATSLIGLHRPKLPEEEGKRFDADKKQVTRELPLELVFTGTESSVREFLSSLVNDKSHYFVVRSWKIQNEKPLPPRKTDAKFGDRGNRGGAGNLGPINEAPNFNELFNGEAEEPKPAGGANPDAAAQPEAPEPAKPEPAPASAPEATDGTRILEQVLGQEEIQVFVRIDLLIFLEAKKLP